MVKHWENLKEIERRIAKASQSCGDPPTRIYNLRRNFRRYRYQFFTKKEIEIIETTGSIIVCTFPQEKPGEDPHGFYIFQYAHYDNRWFVRRIPFPVDSLDYLIVSGYLNKDIDDTVIQMGSVFIRRSNGK